MIPEDFDWEFYTIFHKDLHGMNKKQARRHYIKYGEKEKRRYNGKLDEKYNTFFVGGKMFQKPDTNISSSWYPNYEKISFKLRRHQYLFYI